MIRVARLNEHMWTELFIENSEYLADEIDGMIERQNTSAISSSQKQIRADRDTQTRERQENS